MAGSLIAQRRASPDDSARFGNSGGAVPEKFGLAALGVTIVAQYGFKSGGPGLLFRGGCWMPTSSQ